MDTTEIIARIDSEIARLEQVKGILSGTTATTTIKAKRGPKPKSAPTPITAKKRVLSPEARGRIAAAQKARWAKVRKAAKAA
jgi:hypothetical protein